MNKRRLVVLGSTGSIGEKALAVARRFPERFDVIAIAAMSRTDRLAAQAAEFQPEWVAVGDPGAAQRFDRASLPAGCRFVSGSVAFAELAGLADAELVVNGLVGSAGLPATLAALERGTQLALANKESIVLAGELVMRTARLNRAAILPIDSEHSALFQCLRGVESDAVRRVVLTASGGPFRRTAGRDLEAVTPAEALHHPIWPMGPRITVDSATLLNKGFEVIEAHWLFDLPLDRIEVLVHPQSIVHALVEMADGSTLAQLAAPDMALPVQLAMSWPERWDPPLPPLDLTRHGPLEFLPPDHDRFPCLGLAYRAARQGGVAPAMLNAADEVAVEAFLAGTIRFTEIPAVLGRVLDRAPCRPADSLDAILEADREARRLAEDTVRTSKAG